MFVKYSKPTNNFEQNYQFFNCHQLLFSVFDRELGNLYSKEYVIVVLTLNKAKNINWKVWP